MINEIHRKLFYFLSLKNEYVSSSYLAKKIGVSVRTIKKQLKDIDPFLKDRGCHLVSKRRFGYKLISNDSEVFTQAIEENKNYIKYSHSYKDMINEILSYFVNNILFTDKSFSIEELADELYISPTAFRKHFYIFVEQLKTFDIEVIKDENGHFKIKGREKDLRLLAKDYLVIKMTEILDHEYDFDSLSWATDKINFYEIYKIVESIFSTHDITMFEVGRFRISCYLYISFLRTTYPIDINVERIRKYISRSELTIADDILLEVRRKYLFIDFQYEEVISLALNIMCERDYTSFDINNHTISDALLAYTQKTYDLLISYNYLHIFLLFPEEETIVWLISISAKIIASNHKQNKPYFFYNDKAVYYSSFSFFIARLTASFIRQSGFHDHPENSPGNKGPTLNIYCISYITNMIYNNLMLLKPDSRKISIGIYSFLGRLTSESIKKVLETSTLSNYISSIEVTEPKMSKNVSFDILFYHQEIEHKADKELSNIQGINNSNFIDENVIFSIKDKFLETSGYKKYLSIINNIRIIDAKNMTSFQPAIDQYNIFSEIKTQYQIVNHENDPTAFMFIKQKEIPILDIYLLKNHFSSKGHRYKTLCVISCDLTNDDPMYYKTMEALSQVLSRYSDSINIDSDLNLIKNNIIKQIEKYLVETLI